MKKHSLFVFLACIIMGNMFANGLGDISNIPVPDVQIELPGELTGAFEFVYEDPYGIRHDFYGIIEIYKNNTYWWRGDSGQEWGRIIEEGGDYYFLPLGSRALNITEGYYIREKTKIVFTENGFSFTAAGMGSMEFAAVRKREE
jgi:hypothetical protein